MNFAALRQEVLNHGFDPVQFGSSRINQFLNDAYGEICRRVDYYIDEGVQDFSTSSGTATYPQPTDFAKDRSLRDTNRDLEMVMYGLRTIDRSPDSNGPPYAYAIDGTNLHLYPTPDGVYPFELRYWKLPTALVNDGDTPTLPADYHKLIWWYAVGECYMAEDDLQTGQLWMQRYEAGLKNLKADVKFPSTDMPNQIASMWGNRRLRRGWTLW